MQIFTENENTFLNLLFSSIEIVVDHIVKKEIKTEMEKLWFNFNPGIAAGRRGNQPVALVTICSFCCHWQPVFSSAL